MFRVLTLLTIAFALATTASAGLIGSWEVDSGPSWTIVPPAYSGQEAAALLFGGSPSDYFISIDPGVITHTAWVSTWGGACGGTFPCGTEVPEGFVISTGGFYASPGDTSAYVHDWAVGAQYTNYAFAATPEPGTVALLGAGLVAVGLRLKRRK
jgi:hypothetical protein